MSGYNCSGFGKHYEGFYGGSNHVKVYGSFDACTKSFVTIMNAVMELITNIYQTVYQIPDKVYKSCALSNQIF